MANEPLLLVGAAGFVGRHLTRALLDSGKRVIAITRRGQAPIDPRAKQLSAEALGDDLHAWTEQVASVGAVMHLASGSNPGSSAGAPRAELTQNLLPLFTLLEALQSHAHIPLHYMSSAGSLYGAKQSGSSAESDLVDPRSYHGAGKVAAEHFIRAWCAQFGGTATIIRPSNVYGPGQEPRPGFGVIPNAFARMLRGLSMDVWGDGSQTRDYIFVSDVVDLCVAALRRPARSGALTVNAASGSSTSLNDLFTLLEGTSGLPLKRTYFPQRAVDADRVAIDIQVAAKELEWMPRMSLKTGLEETWRWIRSTEG
ncbi:NAD-dependent epimerase/dehydratase family protein [Luteibacter sp. 9133]|uniref:NAD-dependent epimerase/dehydratase family protein n=1 Tax=Luteibacter sp. 9133 TaxID=1500891 RepID=UPI0005B98E1D|nr:NAD-dependent epimerase/dehydratase family protein [Luteibacter sp. 9133]